MMIRLLCIDLFCDYNLIDIELLSKNNIEPHFILLDTKLNDNFKNLINTYIISKFNYQELFKVAKIIKPHRIVCFSEELFFETAKLNSYFNCSGIRTCNVDTFSNKLTMIEKVKKKIVTPHTFHLKKQISYNHLTKILNSNELICKPLNQSGSFGVRHIKNEDEYILFLNQEKQHLNQFIAQNFIKGEFYHSELVVQNNNIMFYSARKYSRPNLNMLKYNHPIFSCNITDPNINNKIINASFQVQSSIGLKNGIMHTEFFIEEDTEKVIFIETNLRSPGIGLNYMYQDMLGISLETILCLIICSKKIPKLKKKNDFFVCGYYPISEGKLIKFNNIELGVNSKWKYFAKEGDDLYKMQSMSKLAMVVCNSLHINEIKMAEKLLKNHIIAEIT